MMEEGKTTKKKSSSLFFFFFFFFFLLFFSSFYLHSLFFSLSLGTQKWRKTKGRRSVGECGCFFFFGETETEKEEKRREILGLSLLFCLSVSPKKRKSLLFRSCVLFLWSCVSQNLSGS